MDSGEFRSEGVGPQPRDWHSSARMKVRKPLGSQGAHAWLPALLGHGAAWHRDCPCSPSPSPAEMIWAWDSARTAPRHRPLPGAHTLPLWHLWRQQHQESTSLGTGGQQVLLAAGQVSTGTCPGDAEEPTEGCRVRSGHRPQTQELPHFSEREALPWRNVTSARLACASKSPCHIQADPRAEGERSVPGARGAEGV